MKRLWIIFVMIVLWCTQIGYANEPVKSVGSPIFNIQKQIAYVELQSGTTGEFVYILDQNQIQMIQNFLKTTEYVASSIEELDADKAVGGFQYVIIFYCDDGTGYRFNKEKDFITTGGFSDIHEVIKLTEKSDKEFMEFLNLIYESQDNPTKLSISPIAMLNRTIEVKPSNHQLRLIDLHGSNTIQKVPSYIYSGYHYFRLRDISQILRYDMKWDKLSGAAVLMKDAKMKANTEFQEQNEVKNALISSQTIMVNGEKGKTVFYANGCINIDGYNYFKLRDLETMLDFKCNWDANTNTIMICVDEE